jgi:hypothetical protein
MPIAIVPSTHVDPVWPTVAPFLEKALYTGHDECTIEQLRMMVTDKRLHLLVTEGSDGVTGAATIEFENLPNKRIAFVTAIGGRGLINTANFEDLKHWCRSMGASEIRAHAGDAQARLNARVGFVKRSNVVGVDL